MNVTLSAPFTLPSESQLKNLDIGCFVAIKKADECVWVEIDDVDGERLVGKVHNELADHICTGEHHGDISFNREQVVYLGCGRYCFC